jgi:hypothetical protein
MTGWGLATRVGVTVFVAGFGAAAIGGLIRSNSTLLAGVAAMGVGLLFVVVGRRPG